MYQGKRFLAIITARGGSKGIPRKNIRPLADKPLIAWTIQEAKKSKYIDRCIVSTEDEEIAKISEKYGGDIPFLRPRHLAQDDSSSVDVVLDVMERFPDYDYVVLLQPTSPLRTIDDIDGSIDWCMKHNAASCVSVTEAEHSPYWMYKLDEVKKLQSLLELPIEKSYQRQKLPQIYRLNGAVYINSYDMLKKEKRFVGKNTIGYIMPQERSYDIDTLLDFEIAEVMMKKIQKSNLLNSGR